MDARVGSRVFLWAHTIHSRHQACTPGSITLSSSRSEPSLTRALVGKVSNGLWWPKSDVHQYPHLLRLTTSISNHIKNLLAYSCKLILHIVIIFVSSPNNQSANVMQLPDRERSTRLFRNWDIEYGSCILSYCRPSQTQEKESCLSRWQERSEFPEVARYKLLCPRIEVQ